MKFPASIFHRDFLTVAHDDDAALGVLLGLIKGLVSSTYKRG